MQKNDAVPKKGKSNEFERNDELSCLTEYVR